MSSEVAAAAPATGPTAPMRAMQQEDDRSFREWLDSFAPDGVVRVQITRKKPQLGPNGENLAGVLDTVEERIDEDYLREHYGGGQFQLKIFRINPKGSWEYAKSRQVQIAGPPKQNGHILMPGAGAPIIAAGGDSDSLAERAMSTLERGLDRERQRADRAQQDAVQHRPGMDPALLESIMAPLRDQAAQMAEQNRMLQKQLADLAQRPPPTDPFRDQMVKHVFDGETARLDHLRTQYEQRISKLQDDFADERRRLLERQETHMERLERQHERELLQQEKAQDQQAKALEMAHQTRIESLRSDIAKLERELQQALTRNGALEARKDQSLTEKAEELVKVREALDGIGGGAAGDEKAWYEKLIEGIGSSEVAMSLVNRIGSATGASQPPPAPVQPGQMVQGPDGQLYVMGPDGQPRLITPKMRQRLAAVAAARQQQRRRAMPAAGAAPQAAIDQGLAAAGGDDPGAAPAGAPPGRAPDASEVQLALKFMEGALQNGTAPETFATTARSMVPQDILRFIGTVGVDQFLSTVLEPASTSPLATQRGRTWVRAVFKTINGG